MKKNMGSFDRTIRLIIAIVLIFLNLEGVFTGTPGVILMVVSVILLFTSIFGICPLYSLLGIRSTRKSTKA